MQIKQRKNDSNSILIFPTIGCFQGRFGSAEALPGGIGSFGPFVPLMLTASQTMRAFTLIIPSFLNLVGHRIVGSKGRFSLHWYRGSSWPNYLLSGCKAPWGGFVKQIIPEKTPDVVAAITLAAAAYWSSGHGAVSVFYIHMIGHLCRTVCRTNTNWYCPKASALFFRNVKNYSAKIVRSSW